MNKMRKKSIYNIIQRLSQMLKYFDIYDVDQVINMIEDIMDEIQQILDDEENYFYNIPENLQNGERYAISEEACDNLQDAISELEYVDHDDAKEYIENCILNAIKSLNNCI